MGKKDKDEDKDRTLEEYEKLRNEMLVEKVDEIFRTQPENYIAALEEIGFTYVEEEDEEEIEEKNARSENQNQRDLVAYFEGEQEPSEAILATFLAERDADHANLPLIRKYFKQANQKLKGLLLYGLDQYPARHDLLYDLDFFHEFENVLSPLITYYTRACVNETNLRTFTELAQDFYYATNPDGYEAFYALRDLFEPHTNKRRIIDFLISEEEAAAVKASEPLEF